MNWLNLELTILRSEEYLGSDPVQRATWLNLLAYCADQENGGKITDAAEWGSRRWLQIVGVTKEEVETVSSLWAWKEGVLHVWKYPRAKEAEVRAKRVAGRKGGRPPKTKGEKPDGTRKTKPSGLTELKGSRNGIGIGIGKERNIPPKSPSGGNILLVLEKQVTSPKRIEAFKLWLQHKKEKGQTYKPTGLKTLIKRWADQSDAELEAAVKHSISQNYTGLFAPKPSDASPGGAGERTVKFK